MSDIDSMNDAQIYSVLESYNWFSFVWKSAVFKTQQHNIVFKIQSVCHGVQYDIVTCLCYVNRHWIASKIFSRSWTWKQVEQGQHLVYKRYVCLSVHYACLMGDDC